MKKGKSCEVIAEELEETIERVKEISSIAEKYAPEYDSNLIYM